MDVSFSPPPHIAAVCPATQLYSDLQRATAQLEVPVTCYPTTWQTFPQTALQAQAEGAEVILTRGLCAPALRESLSVPVLTVDLQPHDFMRTVVTLKGITAPIGLAGFADFVAECIELADFLGVKVHGYQVNAIAEVPGILKQAFLDGVRHILGGDCFVALARQFLMRGHMVYMNEEVIANTLSAAARIAEARSLWRERAQMVSGILNATHEGIVAIDPQGRVTLLNRVAEAMLGVSPDAGVGIHISALLPDCFTPQLKAIYDTAARQPAPDMALLDNSGDESQVVVGGRTFLVQIAPLTRQDGECSGLLLALHDVTEVHRLEAVSREKSRKQGFVSTVDISRIVGNGEAIKGLKTAIKRYARTEATLLITGESGTGKDLVAQSVHNASPRRSGPFVPVNCAALPEQLLESELFGYQEGAFTGARKGGKIGLFEHAHGGTLFLDEVGELAPGLQASLLRVLQDKRVLRVGGDRLIPVDVRVIASTNRLLREMIRRDQFRLDLYYRLSMLHLNAPALRERIEDIPLLVDYFLEKHQSLNPRRPRFAPGALALFNAYSWPGNIRELEHVIMRLLLLEDGPVISPASVAALLEEQEAHALMEPEAPAGTEEKARPTTGKSPRDLRSLRDGQIRKALDGSSSMAEAAQCLGVSRTTLWRWKRAQEAVNSRNGKQ